MQSETEENIDDLDFDIDEEDNNVRFIVFFPIL